MRVAAFAAATLLFASAASADEPPPDYDTPRFEPAGLPIIAGDSDIGVEVGAVGTLTRFADGVRPYRWNADVLVAASFKDGPKGLEVAQQNYLMDLDYPDAWNGLLRLHPQAAFTRTVNQGYYGLGNATNAVRPAVIAGTPGRYFQFVATELEAREITRIRIAPPFYAVATTIYRYDSPATYAGSKLAADEHEVHGTRPLSLLSLGGGGIYDTRDNEHFSRRGMLHQVGVKYVQGFPTDQHVHYIQTGGFFAGYLPIVGPVTWASRVVVDFQIGNVPFYDLARAGPFESFDMLGGSTGVRGVPVGRYNGPVKALTNQELRAMLVSFTLFKQAFRIGGDLLFDTGRIWSDYTFKSPADGRRAGLKWGAGGGLYLQWGQAAVFRVEAAYSPDAASENPRFPIGLYVNDGISF
jgi:hypothetical protein